MYFNDRKKELLKLIQSNNIVNIHTALKNMKAFEEVVVDKNPMEIMIGNSFQDSEKTKKINLIKSTDYFADVINEYVNICKVLEDMDLIQNNKLGYEKVAVEYYVKFEDDYRLAEKFMQLTGDLSAGKITPTPLLDTFIDNDFKTKDDIELAKEIKSRKRAEKFTLIIAIVSVVVSLTTVVFNYLTYDKTREIYIKSWPNNSSQIEIKQN